MNKREFKIVIALILFLGLIFITIFIRKNNNGSTIKQDNIKIENQDILLISKSERKKCIEELIEYLNKDYYYACRKIVFYKNQEDSANNEKYFYALVIGGDESLIEITNIGNGNFKYLYIGNELTPNATSNVTGVSYNQIVNYEEYKMDKELEEIREEAKSAQPDDTEMP